MRNAIQKSKGIMGGQSKRSEKLCKYQSGVKKKKSKQALASFTKEKLCMIYLSPVCPHMLLMILY